MERCFLVSHFLVIEDYELSESTTYLLRVSLTLKYLRILSWSISFFTSVVSLTMLCVRLLAISCDKASDLL